MKGIIITSHGNMAQGLLDTTKLFFGEQPQIKAFCLQANDNPDDFVEVLKNGIKEVDTGDGVVVFCDMLFGSPCNCMLRVLAEDVNNSKLDVVTGVNLAMVLQILSVRENSDCSVQELIDAGNQGIADLKQILKQQMK